MEAVADTRIRYVPSTLSGLKRAAWREHKETLDVQGRLGETQRAADYPPGRFVVEELGFGFLEGPSLMATMQDLRKINRRNRYTLEHGERPAPKPTRKRLTGDRAQRIAQRLLKQAAAR